MWLTVCLLFVIYPGLESASYCDTHSYQVCAVDQVPDLFPGTSKQLTYACKTLIPFIQCVIRHEETCESEPNFLRMHYDYLRAGKRMCDKDSPVYPDVVKNLACVKPLFDGDAFECYDTFPGHKGMKRYAKALRKEGLSSYVFTKNKEDRKECLKGLYVLHCQATKMHEECGYNAVAAFIEHIYVRNMMLMKYCNERVKDRLIEIYVTFTYEDENNEIITRNEMLFES